MSLKQALKRANQRANQCPKPRPVPTHSTNNSTNNLPSPSAFYARFGITLKRSGWQMVRCPFHDDTHASLSINGTHGGFICHACGVKGSMIGFYMRSYGVDFKTAIQALSN